MANERAENKSRVYAVIGVPPEIQAYAMAKYSRSSQGMEESVAELSTQKAEQFLDTFYFQYGHGSIADLAHVVVGADNKMIIDAVEVCGDPQFDGQERSTRYQNFTKSSYGTPPELGGSELESIYDQSCERLFQTYNELKQPVTAYLRQKYDRPDLAAMDPRSIERTVNARSFDRTRYLLPGSTLTGFAMVISARTAEKMISRLLSDPRESIQAMGLDIRTALKDKPAYNPLAEKLFARVHQLGEEMKKEKFDQLLDDIADISLQNTNVTPTLVKYTNPKNYLINLNQRTKDAASQYLTGIEPSAEREVSYYTNLNSEVDLAARALYKGSDLSFGQVLDVVQGLSVGEINDLVDLWYQGMGTHDGPIQDMWTGYKNIFDLTIDYGAFRDMNRHRRCAKLVQMWTPNLGYDTPSDIIEAGVENQYKASMDHAILTARKINETLPSIGQYALPLGSRVRLLMAMDDAEVQYLTELRTKPGGHESYRDATYKMYEEYAKKNPVRAKYIRISDPLSGDFWAR